jgi:glucose-1-phosphate thymidylyltransferase
MFERLLGDGSDLGMILKYAEQPRPDGLAQALIIAEDFLDGAPSCLILGDNLFFGNDLVNTLKAADERNEGASVFGYHVIDPERYGVVEFNKSGKVISIEEKPKHPKSNYAVPGIYFYDSHAPTYAKVQEPSARGELEITDLNQRYLEEGKLHIEILGRGTAWLDTGTHDSLSEASSFVEVVQKRQGLKIACIEEIALERGFIDENKIMTLDITKSNNSYGHYVASLRK